MCGIVGSINTEWAKNPVGSILHRGPDNQSSFKFENVFLGHTRLSILDLSDLANQPMMSSDERFVLVYNGEFYNHRVIRKDLLKKGYKFKSTSDTETLLYSWAEWGVECIQYLKGIFAFSILDKKENKLFIARDRFGVKPLYIYQKNNTIAFSSEIKALINISNFDSSINYESIANYLTFLWSPGTNTMYNYVKKLLPGNVVEIDIKNLQVSHHNLKNTEYFKGDYWDISEDEWVKNIDDKLNLAVQSQMLSDAPLGFFLSGGLDSSLLVAIAKSQKPNDKLECFTIDQYKESKGDGFVDDLPYAKKVASYLDVSLNIIDGRADWLNSFDNMVWQLDEPQADLAPINVSLISQFAKEMGIKVLIGGTGGDDIFSGYRRHQALLINNKLEIFPKSLLKMVSSIIQSIPSGIPKVRRLQKLSRDWGANDTDKLLGYFNWLPNNELFREFFSIGSRKEIENYAPYSYGKELLQNKAHLSQLDKI